MYLSRLHIPLTMCRYMGVYPEEKYRTGQIIIFLIIFISQWIIIYLAILHLIYKDHITISDLTNALETLFLIFHAMIKLSMFFVKESEFHDLLERINYFWKVNDVEDEVERKKHQKYLKLIKIRSSMYNFWASATSVAFMLKPFLLKGDNSIFTTASPTWIPSGVMTFYEEVFFAFGVYGPIAGMDLFTLALLLLTRMQFDMLNQEIQRVFQNMTNSEENVEETNERIKKIVDYHNFLLDYVNRINNALSEGMFLYIVTILLSMCVEMYIASVQKSVMVAIQAIMYASNGLLQYCICYCLPAQSVTDEAELTAKYVYFNNWNEHPLSSVKVAQIMIIARAQQRTLILAGGFIKLDLETYLKTLKTMISYAMFLRTMGIGQD
ncbi:uncharacterized protein LOC108909469 [Anoplophora glabripennis]|uniref:uncharacterized protein LOC108909469 n=1 Tax=Anoplophora glabripennis TaxID=217634 RepID=UPI000A144A07|nr:uncharacterized protein LOC108909469 [Anoplophora glabripennis]